MAALKQGGTLQLTLTGQTQEEIVSAAKMNALNFFVASQNGELVELKGSKAVMSNGAPAKIKRKNKKQEDEPAEANPWANLDQNGGDAKQIDEDTLMKSAEEKAVATKFCGDKDIMQGAKPCANCTCGLKE